jgi:hypothetical protein
MTGTRLMPSPLKLGTVSMAANPARPPAQTPRPLLFITVPLPSLSSPFINSPVLITITIWNASCDLSGVSQLPRPRPYPRHTGDHQGEDDRFTTTRTIKRFPKRRRIQCCPHASCRQIELAREVVDKFAPTLASGAWTWKRGSRQLLLAQADNCSTKASEKSLMKGSKSRSPSCPQWPDLSRLIN